MVVGPVNTGIPHAEMLLSARDVPEPTCPYTVALEARLSHDEESIQQMMVSSCVGLWLVVNTNTSCNQNQEAQLLYTQVSPRIHLGSNFHALRQEVWQKHVWYAAQ